MRPLSERIKDFPIDQFIDWLCLACVDVREVRTEEDAQEEINKIREAVTARISALEQRGEAKAARASQLESEFAFIMDENDALVKRVIAAEAKLAELEKQESKPSYFLNRIESSDKWGPEVELRIYESQLDACKSKDDHGGGIIELFTRPAPAVSLAEQVPCPYPCGWKNLLSISMADAAFLARGLIEGELVTEAHRGSVVSNNDRLIKVVTAILRNIEEAK